MNKVNLNLYPTITYNDLIGVLKTMNFMDESTEKQFIYTYHPLNAKIILPLPMSKDNTINKAHLWGNVFILQEKGIVSSIDAFYKIIENQKYFSTHVLV